MLKQFKISHINYAIPLDLSKESCNDKQLLSYSHMQTLLNLKETQDIKDVC